MNALVPDWLQGVAVIPSAARDLAREWLEPFPSTTRFTTETRKTRKQWDFRVFRVSVVNR